MCSLRYVFEFNAAAKLFLFLAQINCFSSVPVRLVLKNERKMTFASVDVHETRVCEMLMNLYNRAAERTDPDIWRGQWLDVGALSFAPNNHSLCQCAQ